MRRRLVVCTDGTWNTPDQVDRGTRQSTNVVKIARATKPEASDGTPQIVYYHEGVGTHWGLDRFTGGAFGSGISKNICDAYRFLIDNYSDGDDLFLFGFSRGAYTARSLAGLIRNCGLLRKDSADLLPDAYALYRRRDPASKPSADAAQRFRARYSREIRIKFIGVWDTVGALGIPLFGLRLLTRRSDQFHDVALSSYVDNAFQALAIDEQRKPFTPTIWQTEGVPGQTVEQMWFSGVHSNVGGGYADSALADVAFLWIAEKARQCGLELDQEFVAARCRPSATGELRSSMTWWYRLLGRLNRPIGVTTGANEHVHPSAIERSETLVAPPQGPYRPPNLVDYIDRASPGGSGGPA